MLRSSWFAWVLVGCDVVGGNSDKDGSLDSDLTTAVETDGDTGTPYMDPRPRGPHGTLDASAASGLVTGATAYEGAGADVVLADVDLNGTADLLAMADQGTSSARAAPYIAVWHDVPLGEHSFLDAIHTINNDLPVVESSIQAIEAMDLTGDGQIDLLVSRSLPDQGAEAVLLAGPITDHRSLADAAANTLFESDARTVIWTAVPDVTGDGMPDLVAGEPEHADLAPGSGSLWVFAGPLSGRREEDLAWAHLHSDVDRELLGGAVAAADFDGDGVQDLAIPAAVEHVYILSGPISGDPVVQSSYSARYTYDPEGSLATSIYTTPVFGGDLNGDGIADLAFGSQDLRVIEGPVSGEMSEYSVTATLPGAGDFTVGDVNGDGMGDFLVGNGAYNPGVSADQGVAYLYYGPVLGSLGVDDGMFVTANARDRLGESVEIADADGDGFDDIAIGAPGMDTEDKSESGAVLLFRGGI